jgi:hypothetical protein
VALVCVLIEAAGQLQAGHVLTAYIGAALTGFWLLAGVPGVWRRGREARAAAEPRRRDAFAAFLDISPCGRRHLAVCLAGAIAVALSAIVAVYLVINPPWPAA